MTVLARLGHTLIVLLGRVGLEVVELPPPPLLLPAPLPAVRPALVPVLLLALLLPAVLQTLLAALLTVLRVGTHPVTCSVGSVSRW